MLEKINEQIEVLVAFMLDRVIPLSFSWKNKKYSVDKVNLVNSEKVGQTKLFIYSVSSGNDYFKLCFNTNSNNWSLIEAYYAE